ncbi:MAG: hypothetical protein WA055_00585 [Candidatus Moraniibacteriota bacterium]
MASENMPNTSPNNSYGEEGVVSQQKKKKQIIIAGVDYEKEAMDAAEARMTANKEDLSGPRLFQGEDRTSKEQIKGIGNVLKKVWKHNLFHEYYRQKELSKARRAIKDSGNLYVAEKGDQTDHDNAMQAIVDRFSSEYEEDMIHSEAGEKKKTLGNESTEEQELKVEIQDIIRKYATGEIDENEFLERKDRLFNRDIPKIKGEGKSSLLEKSNLYASNILEIAKEVRQAVEHGEALNNLDLDFEVIVGKANVGVRTENNFSSVDKVIDKIQKSKLGMVFANETAIALGVASLYSVFVKGSVSTAQKLSKLLGPLGLGISAGVGGAVAGIREGKRVQEERTQHSRDMAKGKSFEKNAERRTEMEKYRHETKGATELTENLEKSLGLLDEKDGKSIRVVLAHLNEIEARISLSDQKSIDLIQYSDAKKIEQERMQLDLVRAKAKVELRKINGGNVKNIKEENVPLKEYLEGIKGARINDFLEEKTIKDEAFHKFRQKKMGGAFVKGALIGAGVGIAVQEGMALLGGNSEGLLSAKEAFAGSGAPEAHHFTALEYLRRYVMGDLPRMDASQMHEEVFGNTHFKLPAGVDFHKNANGSFDLLQNGNPIAKGLTLDQNGHLTNEAHQILKDENILTSDSTQQISSGGTKEIIHSPKEYVKNHENLFEKIKRGSWADNDTLKPDKNELKLWWGGEKGTGIDSNGKYVFNMKHMIPAGSSHAGTHWNPEELLKEGKMKLLISLSEDSQNQVVEIPIDANGNAIIDPNSEIGKIAFENVNGHAKFLGRFAEVAVFDGQKDGVDVFNPLATYEGKGLADWKEIVKIPGEEISTTILEIPAENTVDWPYAIPVLGRNPLERTRGKEKTPSYLYYGASSAGEILAEFQKRGIELDSYKTINENGSKKLVNKEGKEIQRNVDRENQRIKEYLSNQDSDYLEELEKLNTNLTPMHEDCRVCINIPARIEEKHIANLLEQFSKQTDSKGNPIDTSQFEINIIVNKKKSETADKTMEIIEKWKKTHSEVKVNAIDVSFDDNKGCVGLARKYITDLSLLRSVSRKKQAGPLYIESEDADMFGVDKRMVYELINNFDNNPSTDVLRGIQDRQPETLQKNDLLFFSRRLWDFMEIFARNQKYRPENKKDADFVWNRVISGGWNTAYTAEAYAQIGGYTQTKVIGEDMEIGQKISVLRGIKNDKTNEFTPNTQTAKTSGLRSSSSPRRFIDALDRGVPPYDDFENQKLKQFSLDELLDRIKTYANADKNNLDRYQKE